MVSGIPGTDEVDLNNLPGPGDPGAPVPPDEIDNNPAQGSLPLNFSVDTNF